ncbi:MAG: hypothetical protein ABI641_10675 [Caldimonas sp.]
MAGLAIAVIAFFALGIGRYLSLDAIKREQGELESWRQARPLVAA